MQKIVLKDVSVGYGNKTIIDTFSFTLTDPSFVAVIGLNGSGKSTLIKALANKLTYSGQISISDNIAFLGQHNPMNFSIDVEEFLLMGRYRHKHFTQPFYNSEDKQLVKELLEEMQISYLLPKSFQDLSGGEQQMLWIAQTLLQDQDVLILDEPTQQLDIRNKRQVFDVLQKHCKMKSKTVFCVTHDLYNLRDCSGLILNLSKEQMEEEKISLHAVEENIQFLETAVRKA